uniref:BHLH domain-containing protein n=1 Tax=Meloidogyne enterolobii TaxID=390850 RepID=A0A6V7VAQ1_MELEN|nr:unnamed protein product [Meloidogyne enterolobii]
MLMPATTAYPSQLTLLNPPPFYSQEINNSSIQQLMPKQSSSPSPQFPNSKLIMPQFINSFNEKPPLTPSMYFWPQELNYDCGKTDLAQIFGFFENNEIKYNQQQQNLQNIQKRKQSSLNGKLSLRSTENNLINLTKQQKNNQSPNTNYNKQLKRIVAVDERAGGGGGGGGSRRYKTPSPQLLRLRREAANARERRRMNHLNLAFDRLRNVLPPNFEEGRRLSKFETLLGAQEYIIKLGEYLEELKKGKRIDKSFLKELK